VENEKFPFSVLIGSKDLRHSRKVKVFALSPGDAAAIANRLVHYGSGNVTESIACEAKSPWLAI
jgi:hypothetical protein